MIDKSIENKLVNRWILNQLALLQEEYFFHFERREINLITTKIIRFTKERLSNEYLELIKTFYWDNHTKKTLLFVYQQLLLLFHPLTPFLTEYIYQEITQEKILEGKIEVLSVEKEKSELWQVDCLLFLIKSIRQTRQKGEISEYYLELTPEFEKRIISIFDFNHFLEPLTKSKVYFFKKEKEFSGAGIIDLRPFGILRYQEIKEKNIASPSQKLELEKKIEFYEKEIQRSEKLLKNDNFCRKAPAQLVESEKKKLNYYQEQKKKILQELKKLSQ